MKKSDSGIDFGVWLKWTAIIVALLGTPTGAYIALDQTYEKKVSAEQKYQQIDHNFLRWQYQQLRREELEYHELAKRRPLDTIQRQRLQEIGDELRRIRKQLGLPSR